MPHSHVSVSADGNVRVHFDANVYSLLAVKKAAYKFADRASVLINILDNNNIETVFSFTCETKPETREKIAQDFCNEVLDQDLRETIATQTEPTRSLILAQAFSKTSLVD